MAEKTGIAIRKSKKAAGAKTLSGSGLGSLTPLKNLRNLRNLRNMRNLRKG